jgi:signal transduction histidine kinase
MMNRVDAILTDRQHSCGRMQRSTGFSTLASQQDCPQPHADDLTDWQPSRNPLFRVPDLLPDDTEATFLARIRSYKLRAYTWIAVLILLITTPVSAFYYHIENRFELAAVLFGSAVILLVGIESAVRCRCFERRSNLAALTLTIAFLIPASMGIIYGSEESPGIGLAIVFLASSTYCLSTQWFFLHFLAFVVAWLTAFHLAGLEMGPDAVLGCFVITPFAAFIMCFTHVQNLRRDFHMQKQNQRKQTVLQNTLTRLTEETERRKKEEALRSESERRVNEQQDQLFHVGRLSAMGEMVAGIAHEIHQPLQSVSTYCGVLEAATEKGQAAPSIGDVARKIVNQVQGIAEIIRRLQNFTRKSESQLSHVDVHELIIDALKLSATEFTRHRIQTELRLNASQNETFADSVQIQQVLVNLLRNACEAMHDTPLADRIVIVITESNSQNIMIRVCDAGHGFVGESHQMFDAFFSTKPSGLGIGLALSRTIIEKHDGQLTVSKNAEAGLTFTIELPLHPTKHPTIQQ